MSAAWTLLGPDAKVYTAKQGAPAFSGTGFAVISGRWRYLIDKADVSDGVSGTLKLFRGGLKWVEIELTANLSNDVNPFFIDNPDPGNITGSYISITVDFTGRGGGAPLGTRFPDGNVPIFSYLPSFFVEQNSVNFAIKGSPPEEFVLSVVSSMWSNPNTPAPSPPAPPPPIPVIVFPGLVQPPPANILPGTAIIQAPP